MENNFNSIVAETENLINETGIGKTEFTKEEIWLKKRVGKITASNCPNLMTKGKGCDFGLTALKEMYSVKYERRTGLSRASFNNSNFDWGHENESNAIEWLRETMMNQVLSCSNDFNDIIFQEPFDGFGDSPDGFVYEFDNKTIEGVIEIKCPVDVAKIEESQEAKEITEKDDYYWQFMSHFLGTPEAKYLLYVIYDGYSDNGVIFKLNRCDHEDNIEKLKQRIEKANKFINRALAGEILSEIITEK